MRHLFFLLTLVLSFFLGEPEAGFCHGVKWAPSSIETRAIVVMYTTGEPFAYASFKVFSPSDRKIEAQAGNADKEGRVVFAVTEPGEWLVVADDGLGHKISAPVNVEMKNEPQTVSSTRGGGGNAESIPLVFRIFFGLSLLANLFAVFFWWTKRKADAAKN